MGAGLSISQLYGIMYYFQVLFEYLRVLGCGGGRGIAVKRAIQPPNRDHGYHIFQRRGCLGISRPRPSNSMHNQRPPAELGV